MKFLVVRLFDDGMESCVDLFPSLDSAICHVKEISQVPYTCDKYKIYQLSSPLTVRYLDNKIFID